jgi:hypothetical protein
MLKKLWRILVGLALISLAETGRAQTGENVGVRAGISHDDYDRLLKKYVNEHRGW